LCSQVLQIRMGHVGREVFPPEPLVARVAPGF